MTSRPTSITPSLLKIVKEQLTCGICLDLYTNPRSLPCLHSFCQTCVERLPVTPRGEITCPSCRTTAETPKTTGGGGFPVAFHLNNLKEVYTLMKKASNQEGVNCEVCTTANANGYCKDCDQFLCQNCDEAHKKYRVCANHTFINLKNLASSGSQLVHGKEETTMNCPKHDDPLKVFCETCEELICQGCTIGDHNGHKCVHINDCYDKHYQILQTALNAIEEKQKNVSRKITSLAKREMEIREQGETVKEEIHQMAQGMIDAIRESERKLTGEVESTTDSKLHAVSSQKESAETSLSRLKGCGEYVKQSLEMDSHQEVLLSKKQMMERMNHVKEEINEEDYNPTEKCDVQFIKNKNITEVHHIGDIVCSTSTLGECRVKKINPSEVNFENETFSFPLVIELPNSHLVTVPLSSLSCSVISTKPITINTTVNTTDHPGVYRILCTPVIRGSHQVNISVNGIQLGSVPVVVPFNPYLDTITPIRTIEGLDKPLGVAISNDGHVIVTEWETNHVTVVDIEEMEKESLSSGDIKFSHPRGIAITPDNFILVADNHKIQKISMDGRLVASVGHQGSKPLEFRYPHGIAISPTTGQIYVADNSNHRIQVLNSDFTFSFTFGSKGSGVGQFQHPRFLAIDNQGIVYVTDNHRIQKFTAGGKYKSHFGPGQLQIPTGIAIVNDVVYVAVHGNNCVSVFSTDGKFIRCFCSFGANKDQLNGLHGISFDNEGYLYICDFGNKRLVVY